MLLQHFDVDGGKLAVEIEGKGPLVICSPGMGDTRDSYAPVASQFVAHGYSVACIDVRGHGDSSIGFNRYGDEATADDLILMAEKLGCGVPVVLAGASFSAAAAVIAAGRRPELIAGIVLLGPFLRLGMGVLGLYIMPLMFMRPWGPVMWRSYATTLWPGLGEEGARDKAAASTASLTRPGHWAAFQATVNGTDHRVVAPWIDKVKASVLVVMGDKDPDWKDPLKEAEWIASNFSDVRSLTVPGAGHAPMLEKSELVGKEVLEFLVALKTKGAFKPTSA